MTVHWIDLVYLLAGWGALDLLLRILLRVPPWPDRNPFDLRKKSTPTHVGVLFSEPTFDEIQRQLNLCADLLCSIWLYVKWDYITKRLTREQREYWAAVLDAKHLRTWDQEIEPDGPILADRWWLK